MGQKVSPIGMRVGVIRDWESRWYAEKDYGTLLMEDVKIREFLLKELHAAYVSRIEIERSKNRVEIIIRAARPGVIIGSNGESIEILKKKLQKMCAGKQIHIKVVEVANPDLDAHLVARAIAEQLEQRASQNPKPAPSILRRRCVAPGYPYPGFRPFRRCGYRAQRRLFRGRRSSAYAALGHRLRDC